MERAAPSHLPQFPPLLFSLAVDVLSDTVSCTAPAGFVMLDAPGMHVVFLYIPQQNKVLI